MFEERNKNNVELVSIIVMSISICIIVALLGYRNGIKEREPVSYGPRSSIPYTWEVQVFLRDEGYDIGPTGADGIIGDYTIKAWNEWQEKYSRAAADKCFEEVMLDERKQNGM